MEMNAENDTTQSISSSVYTAHSKKQQYMMELIPIFSDKQSLNHIITFYFALHVAPTINLKV